MATSDESSKAMPRLSTDQQYRSSGIRYPPESMATSDESSKAMPRLSTDQQYRSSGTRYPDKSSEAMPRLAIATAKWMIQKLRSNGIRSPNEIKNKQKELKELSFSQYNETSRTEKFQVPVYNAEAFIREYFAAFGLNEADVGKLVTQVKFDAVERSMESKVFEFMKEKGDGKYDVYYVALMAEGDMVYISLTSSRFQFQLGKRYRSLTQHEEQSLKSLFLYKSLQNFYASMNVDLRSLPQEDRKFLEE